MIDYWIQRADFSTQDFTAESELEVLKVLSAHDWEGELAFRRQLESGGKECCDPGIGILPGDGRILHICPVDINHVYFHYHYTEKTKRLGIFPSHRDFVRSNMQVARQDLKEILHRFLAGDHKWLIDNTWDEDKIKSWAQSKA